MGFKTGDFPPVDLETFTSRPLQERIRALAVHWAEYGFGTPRQVHMVYVAKLLVLYLGAGITVATLTSGMNPLQVSSWWNEPIFYQKAVLWTCLLEAIGVAGSWGPLAGKFAPMTGGILYWARTGTIKLPPWSNRIPFTSGDSRTPLDVVLYLGALVALLAGVVLPGADVAGQVGEHGLVRPALLIAAAALLVLAGLRDKTLFIAARGEQYLPALLIFALLGPVDMIIAGKLLIVSVWIGAGVSKFGKHFSNVVPPMVSNTPFIIPRWLKRAHYRDFPNDLRPSKVASGLAHIGGTLVELAIPLTLLFSTNTTVTLLAALGMVAFHAFITSTFPLAVPLEWNVLFGFLAVALFVGHPAGEGFSVFDMSSGWLAIGLAVALLFFPLLGNLRPDLVSFLPSMRQYAGNWASALWAFAPGAEDKLNAHVIRPAKNQIDQLATLYPEPIGEITMQQTIAWRSMHSQGRALFSLLMRQLGSDVDRYTIREAEFACNSLIGFNFGDGHLHDQKLIASLQKRCRFEPGEFVVAWVESQAIHRSEQEYLLIDAALGVIERGTYRVADAVAAQPWLPDGPIPIDVHWSLADHGQETGPHARRHRAHASGSTRRSREAAWAAAANQASSAAPVVGTGSQA